MPSMIGRLRPLIKWPGGKARELPRLGAFVPEFFGTYYEPFLGGGAAFFALAGDRPAHLNDANPRLMDFYRAVQARDGRFVERLNSLADLWDAYGRTGAALGHELEAALTRSPAISRDDLRGIIARAVPHEFAGASPNGLGDRLVSAVEDKLRRVRRLEAKHGIRFSDGQMRDHIETAVRGAVYTRVRDGEPPVNPGAGAAEFFFIREFCYGSMFRFSADGKFNIPYGGIAYNRKRFRRKIAYILSDAVRRRLAASTLSSLDFEAFLETHRRTMRRDDFVFLDPPYDSDFSEYDRLAFGLDDHRRLAESIGRLRCSWLLVIKDTGDVRRIYGHLSADPAVRHARFEKSYTYNVRGRNARDTVHLVMGAMQGQSRPAAEQARLLP
jgi:DNA adenine methylase